MVIRENKVLSLGDKRKKLSCSNKSYLVMKSIEVEIAITMKRSDSL